MASNVEERDRDNLMRANGWRLLLIGGIGALIGFAVMMALPGRGAGPAVAALAVIPTLAGIGLLGSSYVAKRAGDGKPFA